MSAGPGNQPENYFAVFGERPRPGLDTAALQRVFLERSQICHPDRVHQADAATRQKAQADYALLNAAWKCLADPKERLGHLLTLERGHPPAEVHDIPAETAAWFVEVAEQCRALAALRQRQTATASPLLRARLVAESLPLQEQARTLLSRLQEQKTQIESDLFRLNAYWDAASAPAASEGGPSAPFAEVEAAWRNLSYLNRWCQQLQEKLQALTF